MRKVSFTENRNMQRVLEFFKKGAGTKNQYYPLSFGYFLVNVQQFIQHRKANSMLKEK